MEHTKVRKVTIRDVARHARVSVATVSHVINGTHYVSPQLRKQVLEAIEALDYRPNRLAQALNSRTIPLLALIVPDISNPYWSQVARAIQDITDLHDYSLIVCSTDGLLEREVRFLRSLLGWISGLILHPYHVTHKQVSQSMGKTIPVVILGDFVTAEEYPAHWDRVGGDNQGGAQSAVEHLIQLGHRRIAFIQGPADTPTSIRRLAGFRRAFAVAGLPVSEALLVRGDYTQEGGRQAMDALLDRPDPPTAVFCANDLSAFGALETAKRRGFAIPQELSIVGFDDIDEAAHLAPPLTTIRQSPRQLGTMSARTLFERIDGRTEPVRLTIEFSLIVRQSTAPPCDGQG
jgi:LacI family transcriptional regulator